MDPIEVGLGWQVVLGIFGFFLAGGLSLSAGNSMVTSLTRGAIGMFGLFLLGYCIRVALRVFVGTTEPIEDLRGAQIDLTAGDFPLPPVRTGSPDVEQDDFIPLHQTINAAQEAFRDIDPEKLAEALRHLDE